MIQTVHLTLYFPSFFVTTFTGIAILFAICNFFKYKKYWFLYFLLSSIIIFMLNPESNNSKFACSSLILIFVLFKKIL